MRVRVAVFAMLPAVPARTFVPRRFFFTEMGISVDEQRCIGCGDCLFVCPTEAITDITPRKRFLRGDTLVGPFTEHAPG